MELMKLIVPRIGEYEKTTSHIKDQNRMSCKSMENMHQLFQISGPCPTLFHTETVDSSKSEHFPIIDEDRSMRFWLPLMYGFLDIVMNGELEVRTRYTFSSQYRALTYLFETLKTHGSTFSPEFWVVVANTIIFTIFQDLGVGSGHSKLISKEEESVWTSTTLIQALRYLVEFFGERYDQVNFMLKEILGFLKACLLQSNETLSRIGATCLQQIIETNLKKLNTQNWDQICDTIEQLVNETIPHAIFFDVSDGANGPNPVSISGRPLLPRPQKKDFEQIISICVQHLLVLQTLSDILNSGSDFAVYRSLEP
jgi:brefeldin A-inhibited guanine nucleotide-exchange protein